MVYPANIFSPVTLHEDLPLTLAYYDNLSRNVLEILLEILLDLTLTNDHISVTNLDLQIYLINPVLLLLIHLFIVLMINITVLVI